MANVSVTNFLSNVGKDSWIHRLDPRTKVFVALFFSFMPLLFTDWRFQAIYILLLIPLWATANIDFRPMKGPFTGVGLFLVIIFLLNALRGRNELVIASGHQLLDYTWYIGLGPLVITSHSFQRGMFLAMRLIAPMTIGLLIISTTDPTYLAKGLKKLKLPTFVVFMILAGLRFIPIVTEQLFNIFDALTVRGVKSSPFERTKFVLLPLMITSLRRTRTMGLACEAKGFGARKWNNFYQYFSFDKNDKILIGSMITISIISLILRFGFGLGLMRVGFIS